MDKTRISVAGESFGAYMACFLSVKRPVENLALRVPTDFPDKGFADTPHIRFVGHATREWKSQTHSFNEGYALDAVHRFTGRILIVASEHDEMVPMQTTENYLSAMPDPGKVTYRLMKGTGHALFNPIQVWELVKTLAEWLECNSQRILSGQMFLCGYYRINLTRENIYDTNDTIIS